jgi:hypothetical protein
MGELTALKENINSMSIIDNVNLNQISSVMQKISQFQAIVQKTLRAGQDYGIIPGTEKPTLLKPGAEKILMLMGLTSEYEVIEKVQDYDNGFFAFTVKCTILRNGFKITEGLGHANTRESRYMNRWVTEKKIPEGIDKSTLQTREKPSKFKEGETYTEYLVSNSDSYTLANTVLKMAKKRSQVDSVLTVASLSEIFTQDLEDLTEGDLPKQKQNTQNQNQYQKKNTDNKKFQGNQGKNSEQKDNGDTISVAQAKRMFALANGQAEIVKAVLDEYGYQKSSEVKKSEYEEVCNKIVFVLNNTSEGNEEGNYNEVDDDNPFPQD